MAVFATVVESGSMRRAARELGLTPSAVSQQIRQLEKETGVTLLRRTTRRLALTDAGQAFHEGCAAMLEAARSAHGRLAELHDEVVGELAVSAPVGFAATHLSRAMQPLLAAHPHLTLRLAVTDDYLDLARERIDVAVTIGTRPGGLVTCSAAPGHMGQRCSSPRPCTSTPRHAGGPQRPRESCRHCTAAMAPRRRRTHGPGRRAFPADIHSPIVTNNQLTIRPTHARRVRRAEPFREGCRWAICG